QLLQQIASNLCDPRCRVEIAEMSLREPQVTVETVQQNLERILQRLEMMLPCGIFFRPHLRLRFQSERAQISEQVPEDLQLIAHRKTIEFQHDRRIKRGDV